MLSRNGFSLLRVFHNDGERVHTMKIRFGTGRRCINPELPISLAGYFNRRMWNAVADDIEVRAAVLRSGNGVAAIINFDLLCINYRLYNYVIDGIRQAGISEVTPDNLLICAIHTHTAPDVGNDPNSDAYCRFAAAKAVEALREASAMSVEGELLSGMAADIRFLFNRRYWMKDGKVVTNPGKLNPDILRPEGEIDPQIPMLAVRTEAGLSLLISSIVNHTDTIGGCSVSADWCGFVRRTLEPEMAPGAMVMQLVGASGNINHFDVSTDMDQTCYAEPKRIGTGYAESIRKALADLTSVSGDGIRVTSAMVKTKPRELSDEEIAAARATVAKFADVDTSKVGSEVNMTSEDLAKGAPFALKYFAEKLLLLADGTPDPEFKLSCLRFGDSAVIASLPSEPFVEIGLALRRSVFQDKLCLVASHGNYNGGPGYGGGYIPNPWNYGRGGYETTPRSSGFSIHTAEKLLEAWQELAKK